LTAKEDKMHQKLSKSPITYVLAQVRFSTIQSIGDYIPKLQDEIRSFFPHFQKVNLQAIQLREDQQPISSVFNQWHFIDKDRQTGIILDNHSITIHTNQYSQFKPLIENLEKVLTRFNEILKIVLFTRIGLRYINLIENGLDNIDIGLRGFQLKATNFEIDKFLTKTETTQLSNLGIIKIQATHVGNKEIISGTKNLYVPPDLVDAASVLTFQNYKVPDKDFLILDLDHFNEQQGDFDIDEILHNFKEFQEIIYQVFCNAVGEQNLKNWA